jgi:hypothetical protein
MGYEANPLATPEWQSRVLARGRLVRNAVSVELRGDIPETVSLRVQVDHRPSRPASTTTSSCVASRSARRRTTPRLASAPAHEPRPRPAPDRDFDLTEVSVPWRLLSDAGHEVVFATEEGRHPVTDPLLITGVIFGQLGAAPEPLQFYRELEQAPAFRSPLRWREVDPASFDALLLPGGHAQGMKQYLGAPACRSWSSPSGSGRSPSARSATASWSWRAPSIPPPATRSSTASRTTCLPKYMERNGYLLTAWKLGRYYRTYPAYVEDETRAALARPEDFVRGPAHHDQAGHGHRRRARLRRRGRRYVSARWPGDAYLFARTLATRL